MHTDHRNGMARGIYVSSKANISELQNAPSHPFEKKKKFNFYFATLTVFKELKSTVIIIRNLLITGHVTNEMPSVPPVARDRVTPKVGAWVGEW